jgi:hypothetical protein
VLVQMEPHAQLHYRKSYSYSYSEIRDDLLSYQK